MKHFPRKSRLGILLGLVLSASALFLVFHEHTSVFLLPTNVLDITTKPKSSVNYSLSGVSLRNNLINETKSFNNINWCTPVSLSQRTIYDEKIPPLLTNYRNPCWARGTNISCVPYMYLAGFPKCGTTDLHMLLHKHPAISTKVVKEPHWITRRQFQTDTSKGCRRLRGLENYLSVFNNAAIDLQKSVNSSGFHYKVFGDDSASTAWDNYKWPMVNRNSNLSEPMVTNADLVHHINPGAKIIITLRNPTDRLYSGYLYFNRAEPKGTEHFHELVVNTTGALRRCFQSLSVRQCVYPLYRDLNLEKVRIGIGIYYIHLLEWLRVFPREQIMVVRLEDTTRGESVQMEKIFKFLDVGPAPKEVFQWIDRRKTHANSQATQARKIGDMLPETRRLLNEFYAPYNQKLAELLGGAFDYNSDNAKRRDTV